MQFARLIDEAPTNGKALPFRVTDPRMLLAALCSILEQTNGTSQSIEETVVKVLAEVDKWEAFPFPVQADSTGRFLLPTA